jgi:hypothetical protein
MKNTHNIACPDLGKTFKFKIRMSQKGTCAQIIMQFWVILGRFGPFYVPILAKAFFQKQECLKKGHVYAPLTPVAPPENGKTFILETRMP